MLNSDTECLPAPWLYSDHACKDTAFGSAVLFHLGNQFELQKCVWNAKFLPAANIKTHQQIKVFGCASPHLALMINLYGCGDKVFLWKHCFTFYRQSWDACPVYSPFIFNRQRPRISNSFAAFVKRIEVTNCKNFDKTHVLFTYMRWWIK